MYEVMRFIENNLQEKISMSDLAHMFGYSKWHFCRSFKQYTGSSFVEYIAEKRMSCAALDILNGNKITDVAIKYGYDSLGGFNKAFLSKFGCSPKNFKNETIKYYLEKKERNEKMYKVTDRVSFLRDETVNAKTMSEKVKYIAFFLGKQGELDCVDGTSNSIIRASATCNIICKSPAFIADGELIVGYNYGDNGSDERFPMDNETEVKTNLLNCGFNEQEIDFWYKNRNVQVGDFISAEPRNLQEDQLHCEWTGIGRCICNNHTVLGYEKVLKYGFGGLYSQVCALEQKNGSSDLYESAKMLCNAAIELGEKYSKKAREMAETAEPIRKQELLEIADICSRVPRKPAENFREALQSFWFAHIINTWEDGINANSLGRLDQIFYPYYKKDIESGVLTREQAFELICCLWIKLYRDYDVQQSCVGGCDSEGKETVNELSYMMLDATEKLDFIRCLSVRFSQKTDKEFLKRALEVVGHVQKGVPFFFNDDVMIPALEYVGIDTESARNYTQIGCVETVIPGQSNPHAVTGETNFLKALEFALNNGKSMMNEDFVPGLETGTIDEFDTYEKLASAVKKQIYHILDTTCRRVVKTTEAAEHNVPLPYKSLLTEGCMETNRDFNNHGAKYDYYQIMFGGIPNLADSLAALKELVYKQKKYTLDEIVYQLKSDFPNELIRLDLVNKAPKFGNDIDDVDDIARDIIDESCDMLEEISKKYGYSFHAQPFTFLWMVDHGKRTAASPDGRHKGEIIAYSVSPMQGRDFNGLTALLNSISKLPTKKTPGTTSAIVEIDPMLYTDRNIDALVDILLTAGEKGLSNVQFNTVDVETLIDAQKNPEKHNNLAVRVSGFSQKFNLIDKDLQDHIIGRTKHTCL